MHDVSFTEAYATARAATNWTHPGEIHFRAYVACWAAQHALALDGDLVECGVGHGIYSKTVCRYLEFGAYSNKNFYLYDTFQGVPVERLPDRERDKITAYNAVHYSEDLLSEAQRGFAAYPNVRIVQGIVPDTLHQLAPDKVAYLSIDMNNATAEMGAIEFFWDRLVSGAVVLLDDYAYGTEFLDQKLAWDSFTSKRGYSVLTLPTGQGLVLKR